MVQFPIRWIKSRTNFRFLHYRMLGFFISFAVVIGTVFMLMNHGLNMGIDFTGGIAIELRTKEAADLAKMRSVLAEQYFGEVSLQNFGSSNDVLVRIQANNENQAAIVEKAKEVLSGVAQGVEYRQVEYVGPTVGKELVHSGFMSLGLALAAMMLYLWFRFEWQYGVGGILALAHDAVALIGFYAITGLEFGLPAIAAVLTIIGYSINDSVVIYDRIRENLRKYKKMPLDEIIDLSVNETLSRTILTGGTVLISVIALILFGGEVIRSFSYAIAFGVIIGTYSSIYVSANVLIYLGLRSGQQKQDTAAQA